MNAVEFVIETIKKSGKDGISYEGLQQSYPFAKPPLYNVLYALSEPYKFEDIVIQPIKMTEERIATIVIMSVMMGWIMGFISFLCIELRHRKNRRHL